jgi:hypothetical protein
MTTYSEKLALAAGSVAAAAMPAAADAKVIRVQPLSIQLPVVPHNSFSAWNYTAWDIDGQYGTDFDLTAVRYDIYGWDFTSGGDNWSGGELINFYYLQSGTIKIYGNGSNKLLHKGGMANLHHSAAIGPTLASGYNFKGSARIHTTSVYQAGWRQYPLKTHTTSSSWVPVGTTSTYISPAVSDSQIFSNLHRGSNIIGFSFDAAGNTHYGWANLHIGGGFAPTVTITDWAYEDEPDTPIRVSSIPAPPAAIPALTVLAMGAAGLRRWRKKSNPTP